MAVTVGDDEADKVVQRALAMGADRGVRIDLVTQDPLAVARALSAVAAAEAPDLVLCGVQSADLANGAVGAALAGLLALPFVGRRGGDRARRRRPAGVERELEGGLRERLAVQLPAVVSVQTGINSPRYVNFRQLKAAEATADRRARRPTTRPVRRAGGWPSRRPGEGAEMLAGRAAEVAQRIVELVAERRS